MPRKEKKPGNTGAAPDWKAIFSDLEAWRWDFLAARTAGGSDTDQADYNPTELDPSVTALAEKYRRDPWAVLVSTILSLRTKDAVTLETSKALLGKAPSPEKILALTEEETEKLCYPAGFYRTKAASLRKIAAILIAEYNGAVPANMDALLALPGVGRKTANLVLTEAFDMDAICVDIHVHRISNRTGWVSTGAPDITEQVLRNILPREYWKRINALLVLYGQQICRPVSPFCSLCVISSRCIKNNVGKSR
ncbi:endonuclease III domain-containing protein [Breznakiella homolactica]|uniref:Endonuclease III n=1 Tax=Breznakiella homolactica TaxID=2798577 RepID=A0A7T8BBY8_9SPIR|nr:endonuclease III [Breznakiella homolactica]QQO11057.1 endonuclease III [Breznakiella homolactica]